MAKFCVDCGEEKKTDIGDLCHPCSIFVARERPFTGIETSYAEKDSWVAREVISNQ